MSKVTDIQLQKNTPGRYSVFLDGEFSFGISDIDLYNLGIKIGMDIDDEFMALIEETVDFKKCLDYGTELISRKMYSEKELKDKLSQRGYTDSAIKSTIDIMIEYGYINDEIYAKTYCEFKGKKDGVKKISYDLSLKGIRKDIIEKYVAEVENDDVLLKLLEQKIKGNINDRKIIDKAIRYCISKGFEYDKIKSCILKLGEEV